MAAETTPDLSEFTELNPKPRKPPCKVGTAITALVTADRDALAAACATDKITIRTAAIRDWFLKRGHDVSVSAITTHRNGSCDCA